LLLGAAPPGDYVLTAASGTFAVTGSSLAFRRTYALAAAAGAYVVTGSDADLRAADPILVAGSGTVAVTGSAVSYRAARVLVAAAGAVAVTGGRVGLTPSFVFGYGTFGHGPFGHTPFGHSEGPEPAAGIVAETRQLGALVEIDTLLRPRNWVAGSAVAIDNEVVAIDDETIDISSTAAYAALCGPDVDVVDQVTENGVPLALMATSEDVLVSDGSWHFDVASRTLTVRTISGVPVPEKLIVATVVECLEYGAGPGIYLRSGVPVPYDDRLERLPELGWELAVEDLGDEGSAGQLGSLEVLTNDGRWQRILATRTVHGQAQRHYWGDLQLGNRDALVLWATVRSDVPRVTYPSASSDGQDAAVLCEIPLADTALLGPICRQRFAIATYPNMDPRIDGLSIPLAWGPVRKAIAYRIASGRWKVSALVMSQIDQVVTEAGAVVTTTAQILELGEFTVSATLDAEAALYVTGVGVAVAGAGELLAELAEAAGLPESRIDRTTLEALDLERVLSIGYQAVGGSLREALTAVGASAFVDWFIDRSGRLTGAVRRVDQGNLVAHPQDIATWVGLNGATLADDTEPRPEGATGAIRITKAAVDGFAHAATVVQVLPEQRHRATFLARPVSGQTQQLRLSLSDLTGVVALSDPFVLEPKRWSRISFDLVAGAGLGELTIDNETVAIDSETISLDASTLLRIYPAYGGAEDVVVDVTPVELVPVELVDDTNGVLLSWTIEPAVISLVRARYTPDLLEATGPYASAEDATAILLHPEAESRTLDGFLGSKGSASTVAAAAVAYYARPRYRVEVEYLDWSRPLELGRALDVSALPGVPELPDHSGLARVVGITQSPGPDLPSVRLMAVMHAEPVLSPQTVEA
jgi:hypothetical protein